MKLIVNLLAFIFVLAIPFALSSQTRKAIPAGRYESLSGIKNTRVGKGTEVVSNEKKDPSSLFWSEILNHFPEGAESITYFSTAKMDEFSTSLLSTKGINLAKSIDGNTNIIFSDDVKRDKSVLLSLKNKNGLVVLRDKRDLKEAVADLDKFEVLLYQANAESHYFLLKLR